jgi:hypothetical protein
LRKGNRVSGRWFSPCGGEKNLLIGSSGGEVDALSLLQFDLSVLPDFIQITHSTLNVFLEENCFPSAEKVLEVFQVVSGWHDKRGKQKQGPIVHSIPVGKKRFSSEKTEFISLNITNLAANWYSNQAANFGILLKMGDGCLNNLIAIAGNKNRNSQLWPYIEVEFVKTAAGNNCRVLEVTVEVTAAGKIAYTKPLNTLIFEYTYISVNTGGKAVQCFLQTSSDGIHWQTESDIKTIMPQETKAFVPDTIGKFSRMGYKTACCEDSTTLDIHIQGRS